MYRLQRTLLTAFYIVSVIAIYTVIAYVLVHMLHSGFFVIAVSSIIYLLLAVLFGSFMTVISYIPSNLAGAFDPVKNDIANRRIETTKDFSDRLVGFLNGFFDFAFLDVEHSLVKIGEETPSMSFPADDTNWKEMGDRMRNAREVLYIGKNTVGSRNLHCYLVPIRFGEQWLGFFAVYTKSRLWKIFVDLLAEFENSFIDDQLMHVIDYQDSKK